MNPDSGGVALVSVGGETPQTTDRLSLSYHKNNPHNSSCRPLLHADALCLRIKNIVIYSFHFRAARLRGSSARAQRAHMERELTWREGREGNAIRGIGSTGGN
ncbi:unnamed protein product [Arctogadus glacialis]